MMPDAAVAGILASSSSSSSSSNDGGTGSGGGCPTSGPGIGGCNNNDWRSGGESTGAETLNLAQVGRQICQECIVARCQRYGLFSKKMRLLLLSSGEGGGGDGLPHSLDPIVSAVRYLQSAHPKVYGSCSPYLRMTMSSDASVRQAFSKIVDELLLIGAAALPNGASSAVSAVSAVAAVAGRGGAAGALTGGTTHGNNADLRRSNADNPSGNGSMTWGRLASAIAVCCTLSADCVLQGHPELVLIVLDCFEEACEERAVYSWLLSSGGWEGIAGVIRAAGVSEASRSRKGKHVWTSAAQGVATRVAVLRASLVRTSLSHPFLVCFAVASCVASLLVAALAGSKPATPLR